MNAFLRAGIVVLFTGKRSQPLAIGPLEQLKLSDGP
jgi:hypothetical protein